ncbi:dual specificity protein phosphatase 26 isoform X1 [Silurus meridionalis]|nr:dual specificity protein phosphatase 26 isoform X1 [Silurus meridionalis]
MPQWKMLRGTGKPCLSQTAKDGTVWVEEDIGMASAVANPSCFTAQAGPTESAKHTITSVLQSFLCLLDMGMLQTIRECTVHQACRTEPDWNLAIHELMAFISILFVRAVMCPVGAIADCWSESFLVPVIKGTMPRARFISVMQHLRFDDKDMRVERVKTDKFAANSYIWTRFNKNCAESFTTGEHMTIDEQLFPTKVLCPFTQYIATKPDKFGIKFWMATDLETKYVCNASPYLEKDPSRQKGERLAENVVMNLMEPFLDDGRNVTTDNFFTSLSLSHRLLQSKTTLLGTCGVDVFTQMARMYSGAEAFHWMQQRKESIVGMAKVLHNLPNSGLAPRAVDVLQVADRGVVEMSNGVLSRAVLTTPRVKGE